MDADLPYGDAPPYRTKRSILRLATRSEVEKGA